MRHDRAAGRGRVLGTLASVPERRPRRASRNQRLARVVGIDRMSSTRFLYWLSRSPRSREHACRRRHRNGPCRTSAVAIRRHSASGCRPLSEQRAHRRRYSSALDDKIELNRRMNRTLESIARAIFKSWFVDFDPVRKKMEGETIGELGLPPSSSPCPHRRYQDRQVPGLGKDGDSGSSVMLPLSLA